MVSSRLHVVYDLDDVLVFPATEKPFAAYGLKEGLLLTAQKTHVVFPGVVELMQLHYRRGDKVSFFSSGARSRNRELIPQLLEKALGKRKAKEAMKKTRIFSKEHMRPIESYADAKEREKRFPNFWGNNKKDLSILNVRSLENVVLIDNDRTFAAPGQEKNLLKVPYTDEGCFNFDEWKAREGIDLKANRIYFLVGFLFEAIRSSKRERKPITEWLFAKQFAKRKEDIFDNCFEELANDIRYYRKGLKILQKINPNLQFCTKESYSSALQKVEGGLVTKEEERQLKLYETHKAKLGGCSIM
jgi:hypothetical protein